MDRQIPGDDRVFAGLDGAPSPATDAPSAAG
jgi:hypothetical protein